MAKKEKIALVLIIIVLSLGGYWWSTHKQNDPILPPPPEVVQPSTYNYPTTTEQLTASTSTNSKFINWITVKNSAMGYEVQTPKGWAARFYQEGKVLIIQPPEAECGYKPEICPSIAISTRFNPKRLPAKEFLTVPARKSYLENLSDDYESVSATGSNQEIFQFDPFTFAGEVDVVISNGRLLIEIEDQILDKELREYLVSSFRFTADPNTVIAKHFGYALEQKVDPYRIERGVTADVLVHYNEFTGEREIILPSLKAAWEEIFGSYTFPLVKFAFPSGAHKLFFASLLPTPEGGFSDLYSFDAKTRQFKKLDNLLPYLGWRWSGGVLSPNGSKFVGVVGNWGDAVNRLYVVNLLTEEVGLAIQLSGLESFGKSNEFGDLGSAKITWLNEHTVEYSVYSGTRFVENRRFSILDLISE